MEAIDTKAMKGIKSYLEHRSFEILEENWAHGGDTIDFIACEEDGMVRLPKWGEHVISVQAER